jgi:hypothetical protein
MVEIGEFVGSALAGAGREGIGGGAFEEGNEEQDYFADRGENARGEGAYGLRNEIAHVFGGQGDGGGIVREAGAEGDGVLVEALGEIAEVKLCFVEAGEISR